MIKKVLNKLFKKTDTPEGPSRITSDTIARHREQILSGGRKFKYPIQYARHKLVFNAIIISSVVLVLSVVIGWWQLYPEQNTSNFFYQITKVLPVPVASVDGKSVLYSDYLMRYLGSVYYKQNIEQINLKTEDGKSQVAYLKRQSMDYAVQDAYAAKLANALKISVSDVELESYIKAQKQSISGEASDQTYNSVIRNYFNWSPDEYRYLTKNQLLRQKVSFEIDKKASGLVDVANSKINENQNISLKILADDLSAGSDVTVSYAVSGWVSKFNNDGGLSMQASEGTKDKISSVVKSTTGDGYYYIKLLDINSSQVNYEYIHIPLSEFNRQLQGVTDNKKVKEFISL